MAVMKFLPRLMRNLFSKPATRKKCPTKAIHADRSSRTVTIERTGCIQCGYCVESCPKSCLSMLPEYTQPDVSKTVDTFQVPEKTKDPEDSS